MRMTHWVTPVTVVTGTHAGVPGQQRIGTWSWCIPVEDVAGVTSSRAVNGLGTRSRRMLDADLYFYPLRDPNNGEAVLMPVLMS